MISGDDIGHKVTSGRADALLEKGRQVIDKCSSGSSIQMGPRPAGLAELKEKNMCFQNKPVFSCPG